MSGIDTVVPSTTLTRRPCQCQPAGQRPCSSRPVSRTSRRNKDSGKRCRALQYGSVCGEQGRSPRETSQASTRLTVQRQEPSGLRTWLRKAHNVNTGVQTASRQAACSCSKARVSRATLSTSAKGKPSAWAN